MEQTPTLFYCTIKRLAWHYLYCPPSAPLKETQHRNVEKTIIPAEISFYRIDNDYGAGILHPACPFCRRQLSSMGALQPLHPRLFPLIGYHRLFYRPLSNKYKKKTNFPHPHSSARLFLFGEHFRRNAYRFWKGGELSLLLPQLHFPCWYFWLFKRAPVFCRLLLLDFPFCTRAFIFRLSLRPI